MKNNKLFFSMIVIVVVLSLILLSGNGSTKLIEEKYINIIEISNAEHLDKDKNLVENIYEDVKSLNGIWSKTIPSGDYVRVKFEKPLTNKNDITIYPKIISGNPRIEIYEKDKNKVIAEFSDLKNEEYNKILLENLEGSQETYDLKILGGNVKFDHIIDPDLFFEDWEAGNFNNWLNRSLTIETDRAIQTNSAKCVTSAVCTMNLSNPVDTSLAISINVSLQENDD